MQEQNNKVKYVETLADFRGADEAKQHIYYSPLFYIIERLGPGTEINLWQRVKTVRRINYGPIPPGAGLKWFGLINPDRSNEKNRGATISVEIQFLQEGDLAKEQFAEVANIITAYKYPPHRIITVPGKYIISITVQPKKKRPKPKPAEEKKEGSDEA